MKIAITGGIACGKSLLSRCLNGLGVETLDADDVVHEILPDPAERRRIAEEVFSDPGKRRELEAKLHPLVKTRIDNWLDGTNGTNRTARTDVTNETGARLAGPGCLVSPGGPVSPVRVAIIPLLFEVHWEGNFDIICAVVSSREKQIERMTTTRGMTREEAEARLAAQMPAEEKARRSHYVIRNEGSPEELKAQAAAFLEWLQDPQFTIHNPSTWQTS